MAGEELRLFLFTQEGKGGKVPLSGEGEGGEVSLSDELLLLRRREGEGEELSLSHELLRRRFSQEGEGGEEGCSRRLEAASAERERIVGAPVGTTHTRQDLRSRYQTSIHRSSPPSCLPIRSVRRSRVRHASASTMFWRCLGVGRNDVLKQVGTKFWSR